MGNFAFLIVLGVALSAACTKFESAHGRRDAAPESRDSAGSGETSEAPGEETSGADSQDSDDDSFDPGGSGGSGGADSGSGGGGAGGSGGATTEVGADIARDVAKEAAPEVASETASETADDVAKETAPEVASETAPETAPNVCANYDPGSGILVGVSAANFCQEYAVICTFSGANRYTGMADCMTKYTAASANGKSCRAGHLCNAKAGSPGVHCVHATGVVLCE